MRRCATVTAAVLALLVAAPAAAQSPPIATVDGAGEVSRAQYEHWLRIARGSGTPDARRDVMLLLIQDLWVRGEAAERGIVVTADDLRREFVRQRRLAFPRRGDLGRFLRSSGFTIADIVFRIRLELTSRRVRRAVVRAAPPVTAEDVRAEYERNPSWARVPERRDVRFAFARTRAAALAGPRRLRVYVRRRQMPVFGSRRGVVRWRGGWLAFRVVRVHPARRVPLVRVAADIRGLLEAERQQEALDAFIRDFRARWKARTACRAAYATGVCGRTTP